MSFSIASNLGFCFFFVFLSFLKSNSLSCIYQMIFKTTSLLLVGSFNESQFYPIVVYQKNKKLYPIALLSSSSMLMSICFSSLFINYNGFFFPLSINNKIMIIYMLGHYSDQQLFFLPNLFLVFPFKGLIGSQLSPYFFQKVQP